MRIIQSGKGTVRAAPMEGSPEAEVLVGGDGERLAVARVVVPPGGGMPDHEHGESEALVLCQGGRLRIRESGREETLEPGTMALIRIGESVSLENLSDWEAATILAFFAPPGFVETLRSWPIVDRSS